MYKNSVRYKPTPSAPLFTTPSKSFGVPMFAGESKKANNRYLLLNNYKSIDCVDWDLSEVDCWPENTKVADWQNKRGRFFIKPVLRGNKIPPKTQVFRLKEWGGAFNIVISEDYKEKIMKLDFDHSFLTFESLKTISI